MNIIYRLKVILKMKKLTLVLHSAVDLDARYRYLKLMQNNYCFDQDTPPTLKILLIR